MSREPVVEYDGVDASRPHSQGSMRLHCTYDEEPRNG